MWDRAWIVVLGLAWMRIVAGAAEAPVVGGLGDLKRVEVRGSRAVTAEQVREGLLRDRDFQLASTPTAPLGDFLRVTREQLLLGYRHNGFPEPKVEVTVKGEGTGLVIDVVEGARCVAGDVRVEGIIRQVDAKRLAAYVATRREAERFPTKVLDGGGVELPTWGEAEEAKPSPWERGEPVPLDGATLERLSKDVRAGLGRQGFFRSRFRVEPEVKGTEAALVVRIEEEGPKAVLGEVEVIGAKRNTPAAVIEYLGLAAGSAVDAGVLQSVQQRLWDSGRFWRHTLTMSAPSAGPGGEPRVNFRLELVEHARAALLGEKLSVDEEAILRCRDWLEKSVSAGTDFVIEGTNDAGTGRIVVKPNEGIAVHWRPARGARADTARAATFAPASFWDTLFRKDVGMVFTSKRIGLYDLSSREQFGWDVQSAAAAKGTGIGVITTVRWVPSLVRGEEEKGSFLLGGGISSGPTAHGFRFDVLLAPVSFVNIVRGAPDTKVEARMEGEVFALSAGRYTFRFERATGRLIELTISASGPDETAARVTIEPGALAREVKALEDGTAGDGSTKGAEALAAAMGHLVVMGMPEGGSAKQAAAARAVRKLLGPAITAALAEVTSNGRPEAGFDIPRSPITAAEARAAVNPFSAVLGELVPMVDRVSARSSWPWTVARESLLVMSGRAKYTHLEAGRLYRSGDVGPVGCLVVARAYSAASDPASARLFAKRGLERLTLDAFGRDCAALFEGDTTQARFLGTVMRSLRELSDEELDGLAVPLGQRWAGVLKTLAGFQKGLPKDAVAVVPPALQRALWEAGVKELLEAGLKGLAEGK